MSSSNRQGILLLGMEYECINFEIALYYTQYTLLSYNTILRGCDIVSARINIVLL